MCSPIIPKTESRLELLERTLRPGRCLRYRMRKIQAEMKTLIEDLTVWIEKAEADFDSQDS